MKVNAAIAVAGVAVLIVGLVWSGSLVAALLVVAGLALLVAGGLRDDGTTR